MIHIVRAAGVVVLAGAAAILAYYYSRERENRERPHRYPSPPRKRRRLRGSQARELTDQLCSNSLECFCCELVGPSEEIFSCTGCHNIFHLKCIKHWARIGFEERKKWICPTCVEEYTIEPHQLEYRCFCGQTRSPVSHPGITPHCCLRECSRCSEQCHPGYCEPM